jgi:hypothetical protein
MKDCLFEIIMWLTERYPCAREALSAIYEQVFVPELVLKTEEALVPSCPAVIANLPMSFIKNGFLVSGEFVGRTSVFIGSHNLAN